MRTRNSLMVAVTVAASLGVASPAFADHDGEGGPGGWVDVGDDDSEVGVGAEDGSGGSTGSGGGSSTGCSWDPVPEELIDEIWWEADPTLVGPIEDPDDYMWYFVVCPTVDGGYTTDLVPVPLSEVADPSELRDQAMDILSLPFPTIAMNPVGDQVVHVATWLWVDDAIWQTHSKSVSAGAVTTTVTATPQRVIWDLGNGDTVVCDGPGTPYNPSIPSGEQTTDCSYTYTHTSAGQPGDAYQATATIEWSLEWTVTGAPGGGPLPALFTSTPVAVRVAEMQALNQ